MAVALSGGPRKLIWEEPAALSPDGALVLQPAADRVRFTRLADGSWWTIYTAGREPRPSPSGKLIAWDVVSRGISQAKNPRLAAAEFRDQILEIREQLRSKGK